MITRERATRSNHTRGPDIADGFIVEPYNNHLVTETNGLSELLERFRRAPEVIAMMLTGVFGDETDFVAVPGKWSIRQIVRHLADSEMVGAYRFRSVLAEENPAIPVYDEAAWASGLNYAVSKPTQSLDFFRRLRADNYELLKDH